MPAETIVTKQPADIEDPPLEPVNKITPSQKVILHCFVYVHKKTIAAICSKKCTAQRKDVIFYSLYVTEKTRVRTCYLELTLHSVWLSFIKDWSASCLRKRMPEKKRERKKPDKCETDNTFIWNTKHEFVLFLKMQFRIQGWHNIWEICEMG